MSLQSHARFVRALCTVVGSLAAGYLWAAVFGKGVPGLKGAVALDDSDSFPDANVAFLAALGFYVGSAFIVAWAGTVVATPHLGRWLATTAVVGACVFVVSRVFA